MSLGPYTDEKNIQRSHASICMTSLNIVEAKVWLG